MVGLGKANLLLRHSVGHFPANFSRQSVLSGGPQRREFALVPERINGNINK